MSLLFFSVLNKFNVFIYKISYNFFFRLDPPWPTFKCLWTLRVFGMYSLLFKYCRLFLLMFILGCWELTLFLYSIPLVCVERHVILYVAVLNNFHCHPWQRYKTWNIHTYRKFQVQTPSRAFYSFFSIFNLRYLIFFKYIYIGQITRIKTS